MLPIMLDGDGLDSSDVGVLGGIYQIACVSFVVDMFHLDFMNFAIFNVAR